VAEDKQVVRRIQGEPGRFMFFCPGCKCGHSFWTENPAGRPIWKFDGNMERPTVEPSILVKMPVGDKEKVCHSFVKDGQIQFCGDSTHELANKTVPLEAF
jgi:hypothetical protein